MVKLITQTTTSITNHRLPSTTFGKVNDAKQFTVYFDGHEKDRFETFFGAYTLGYKPSKSTDLSLILSGFLTPLMLCQPILLVSA